MRKAKIFINQLKSKDKLNKVIMNHYKLTINTLKLIINKNKCTQ